MKIDLFDVEEFVNINHLQQITSPILFQRGDIPHPGGLVSNEIFGVTTKSRRETYAYIDLHGHFFNPHIYKLIKRMFRNIDKIVNGEMYFSINENGNLVPDENGDTGIQFLYDNWEKIKWETPKDDLSKPGMRNERINLINKCKKNEIFMKYQIVIPAFYRDIKTNSSANGGETDDINNMYARLIRFSSLINNQDMFDFQFHTTNFNIQNTIISIYDYFKHKLEKKNGLIRKYLMGKNVDYCTRTVITAPTFHADRPEELFVDFRYSALPISQVCSLLYPFVVHYIKNFFEREVIDAKNAKLLYNPATDTTIDSLKIINPEIYFSDRYIKKMIDNFIRDPSSRFTKIEVPTSSPEKLYLTFVGQRMDKSNTSEIAATVHRPMTWTDLLYLACEEVTRDKHVIITRYPLLDEFGVFISRIRVSSTTRTMPLLVNGRLYKWYPCVDLNLNHNEIPRQFIDSVQFSNSYLPGLDGDYDGDQTTVKILFTQEANQECEEVINRKSYFINSSGSNIRKIELEALQTFFTLTKEPWGEYKALTKEEKEYFINLDPSKITFTDLVDWFGDTANIEDGDKTKINKSKFNPCDTLTISPNEYHLIKGDKPIKTTLGRLIYNKMMIESFHFESLFDYQNKVFTADEFGKFDATVAVALRDDVITVEQMYRYIDMRDWFGLQLHGLITTSFTPGVVKIPPEVVALKKKLISENKEAIENGNEKVMEQIEDQLIDAAKKAMADDPGLDLYISGARGNISNNLKNIMLTRGAIKNPVTKKYDIIENSLMDGLDKKDIATHSNVIISGAYPKAVGTAVSGYLAKKILAFLQAETLGDPDSDCGSLRCIKVTITNNNVNKFMYRYIKTSKELVELNPENKDKFIGKTVEMRSPMYCVGVGEEKCLCNKCAGNFYYKLQKKNIGLAACKLSGTFVNLNMKKFHENLVKMHTIDINDILI